MPIELKNKLIKYFGSFIAVTLLPILLFFIGSSGRGGFQDVSLGLWVFLVFSFFPFSYFGFLFFARKAGESLRQSFLWFSAGQWFSCLSLWVYLVVIIDLDMIDHSMATSFLMEGLMGQWLSFIAFSVIKLKKSLQAGGEPFSTFGYLFFSTIIFPIAFIVPIIVLILIVR